MTRAVRAAARRVMNPGTLAPADSARVAVVCPLPFPYDVRGAASRNKNEESLSLCETGQHEAWL